MSPPEVGAPGPAPSSPAVSYHLEDHISPDSNLWISSGPTDFGEKQTVFRSSWKHVWSLTACPPSHHEGMVECNYYIWTRAQASSEDQPSALYQRKWSLRDVTVRTQCYPVTVLDTGLVVQYLLHLAWHPGTRLVGKDKNRNNLPLCRLQSDDTPQIFWWQSSEEPAFFWVGGCLVLGYSCCPDPSFHQENPSSS